MDTVCALLLFVTGHEAAFAAFLCCLCKIGVLRVDDQLAIIFQVFDRFVFGDQSRLHVCMLFEF